MVTYCKWSVCACASACMWQATICCRFHKHDPKKTEKHANNNNEKMQKRKEIAMMWPASGPEWVVRLSICSNLADNRRHDQSSSRWFVVLNSQNADEDIQILYHSRKNLDDSRTCNCASERAPKHHNIFHFMVYIFCEFKQIGTGVTVLPFSPIFFSSLSLSFALDGSKLSAAHEHWTQRIRMRIECYLNLQ